MMPGKAVITFSWSFPAKLFPIHSFTGPNEVTFEFSRSVLWKTARRVLTVSIFSIWKSFVPFHSYQVFQRGGYFAVEVIPDAVAVISLNTMYFFDSNTGLFSPLSTCSGHLTQSLCQPKQLWEGVRSRILRTPGTCSMIGWKLS